MRMPGKTAVTLGLMLAATLAGAALAADEPKAPAPTLSEVLESSGVTLSGYVDGTYSYASSSSQSYDTFALDQAAFTIAKQPASGFGALLNVVAGTQACNGCYAPGYFQGSTSDFNVLQAYVQYVSGNFTVLGGKFTTLAGAEVAAPTGNSNITRSLLFWYSEPVTHVGVRVAVAASSMATFTVGVNNGWNNDVSAGSGKGVEVGVSLTPSKSLALAAMGHYGDFPNSATSSGVSKRSLLDAVATWTVSPKLTLVGSADFDTQEKATASGGTASWWGAAVYGNYAINDSWRTSLRAEYLDDQDGYATGAVGKLKEGTLTFGYAPAKSIELRFEGRYDQSDVTGVDDVTQAWVEALYKF
jgi:hypothetical protein